MSGQRLAAPEGAGRRGPYREVSGRNRSLIPANTDTMRLHLSWRGVDAVAQARYQGTQPVHIVPYPMPRGIGYGAPDAKPAVGEAAAPHALLVKQLGIGRRRQPSTRYSRDRPRAAAYRGRLTPGREPPP